MNRWIATTLLLCACGGEPNPPNEPDPAGARPEPEAPPEPEPPVAVTEPWLEALLAFDLDAPATDERTIALGEALGSPVTCPQPGTGCYVELMLAGQPTQVHVGDDHAVQVWGPIQGFAMQTWANGVEQEIDRSPLAALNEPGARPDRLWRDARHVLLLHDHTGLPCGGFCPSMLWLARPGHPAAAGYGFGVEP